MGEGGGSDDVDRGIAWDILTRQHRGVARGSHLDVLVQRDLVLELVPGSQGVGEEHGIGVAGWLAAGSEGERAAPRPDEKTFHTDTLSVTRFLSLAPNRLQRPAS